MYNVDYVLEDADNPIRQEAMKQVKAKYPSYDPDKGAGVVFVIAVLMCLAFFVSGGFRMDMFSGAAMAIGSGAAGLMWFFGRCNVRAFREELLAVEQELEAAAV